MRRARRLDAHQPARSPGDVITERTESKFDEQGDGLGMRKEYDFSEGVRGRAGVRPPRQRGAASGMATSRQSDSIDDELTPAQIRELRRRMADLVCRLLLEKKKKKGEGAWFRDTGRAAKGHPLIAVNCHVTKKVDDVLA